MAKKKITQLDLFSGIGGFHLGFEKAGFKVKSYFSEIDKHAVAVYKHKFKNAEYVGSVVDIKGDELPRIDLITFGSPCQDFSLAGKRKGMGGERSSLVLEAIRLIDECRPSVFVWENVKGTFSSNNGADFTAILQAFANIGGYRLEWQLLNTSWVLPQNRERVYLVGYSTKPGRNWRGVFPIGESAGENTKLPRQQANTCTLTTRYGADGNGSYVTQREQYAQEIKANYAYENLNKTIKKNPEAFKEGEVKAIDCYNQNVRDEAPCLTSPEHNTTRIYDGRVQPVQIGQSSQTFAHKSGTLIGKEGQDAFTIRSSNPNGVKVEQPKIIGYTRDDKGKVTDRHLKDEAGTIHSSSGSGGNTDQYVMDYRIRRLTPIECERLQGFPDNHTEYGIYDGEVKKMSNTQRYKQCGNAVTVDIVALVAEAVKPLFK